ncbi:MAG: U32 family peptidase, partial [Calditrichia bacterium]|nr:U32 family peptidase [Calditrichia bacterium]
MNKVELLSPAGNLEKLKYAIEYGADAVYLSGKSYGMRSGSDNFTIPELKEGVELAHSKQKKVFVTVNIFAHNHDLEGLDEYIGILNDLNVDAAIVADYGIFRIIRKLYPKLPVHISTQANVTNYEAALFWQDMGASRITLARELSLKEIETIRKKVDIELEVFGHGAMCMAYSGRCLLSNYLTGRDSNQGSCAHVCRWEFKVTDVKAGKHEMTITEDERGSYIFNSKDLAVIPILEDVINTGINSIKIEGRMKGINYVSQVTKAYREAIDHFKSGGVIPDEMKNRLMADLRNPSNRGFFTGFYEKAVENTGHNYETSKYSFSSTMVGTVKEVKKSKKIAIDVRHKLKTNEELMVVTPKGENYSVTIPFMHDITGNKIEVANPNQVVLIPYSKQFKINSL